MKMTTHRVQRVLIVASLIWLGLPAGALGQDQEAAEGATGRLEEIVVTARKKEESLQEIPVAVTAFSNDLLKELRINSPTEVAAFTPGFSFISAFGRDLDRPVVRGMANILGEANASFFIDGVYVPGTIASTELQSLERVEVIKGPQAALYGRATFAGAINYVTRRPSNEHEAEVSLSAAEHDQYDAMAYFSGPWIEDTLYYYFGASYYQYGGEHKNLIDGKDVGGQETLAFTGKLVYTPSENFDATFRLTYQEDDDDHVAVWLQGADFNNCYETSPERPSARGYYCGTVRVSDTTEARTDFLPDPGIDREILRTALTLNWNFDNGSTLQSITGFQNEDTVRQIDVSYAGYDPLTYLYALPFLDANGSFWRVQEEETDTFSQELRWSSAQDQRLRWTVGAYFYRSEFDQPVEDRINPMTATPALLDPAMAVQMPNSYPRKLETENVALFGGLEYDFNDQWRGTAEVRFAEDKKSADFFPYLPFQTTVSEEETFDSVTPRFTLTYFASDDLTIYGNIAKGNKPGGFNDPGAPVTAYDEEEAWNYEVGFKSTWRDGTVIWNTALFFVDWDDQQLTFTTQRPDGTPTSFVENVGQTEVLGLETELSFLIADNWDMAITYAYIDSEIQEYVNVDQAVLLGCNVTDPGDVYFACIQERGSVAGNQTPRSSEHQASLRTMYVIPADNGREWFLGGDVTYESSRYAQVHNLAETGDATRVGLQVGYRSEGWDFTLWAKNVFDDDTAQDILRYIDSRAYTYAPFIPCPPGLRQGANCGPFFFRSASNIGGGTILPRGFGITLPRGRQIGATFRYRF